MLRKHTRIILLTVAMTMGSCTTDPSSQRPVVFQLDVPDSMSYMKVEDHRLAEEKTLRPPPFGKSEYRLGDENFSPDRLKVLALRFQSKLEPPHTEKTINVRSFEVTIFKPPSPSRPEAAAKFGALSAITGPLIAQSLFALTEERRETMIVACEIQGSVEGRSFKGSSDRVVPDPKADLFNAVRVVVREAIDDAADSLVKAFP